ncbi:MAG: hypothetical protein KAS11_05595 [Candidatus Aenigmarchaeota archaeon]|nr:hypothetical protein [Candidatus Aenigmarchaeota archaeon]
MKKATKVGLFVLVVVGIIVSTGVASAYRGDYSVQGPDYDAERHEVMENAFDTSDYESWYQLMTENGRHPRVAEVVTESNFETFAQAHEAAENGDHELAAELRAELGLNNGQGPRDGTGHGKGMGQGMGQKMSQNNFINTDCDGNCDNEGMKFGRGR